MFKYIQKSLLTNVYFGPQGFQLFSSESEQQDVQQTFSNDSTWNSNWFVVGVDTELGDPYLIIKSSDDAYVYTGVFDGNNWRLIPVAETFSAFVDCLGIIKKASLQEAEVYVPDDKTLSDNELISDLEQHLIEKSQCKEFWQQFIVCYKDWLKE